MFRQLWEGLVQGVRSNLIARDYTARHIGEKEQVWNSHGRYTRQWKIHGLRKIS
jgi:hypothetical protein